MIKNNSSHFLIDNALGLPIQEGTNSTVSRRVSLAFKEQVEVISQSDLQFVIESQSWEEIAPVQIWHWTPELKLNIEEIRIVQGKEIEWKQAMDDVLRTRAKTWEELARL